MRAGGEKRGNSRDRRRRKLWLLRTFDPELGPDYAHCALQLSDHCRAVVDIHTVTADRIEPGGSYAHENIQPACTPCQNTQGALITYARRVAWLQAMEEADYYGIEWTG